MSKFHIHSYPNRLLCDVLDEIRKCDETRNYSYLKGLVEEAQSLGNRMEAKLHDNKDILSANKTLREAKEELKKIQAEIDSLTDLKQLIKK